MEMHSDYSWEHGLVIDSVPRSVTGLVLSMVLLMEHQMVLDLEHDLEPWLGIHWVILMVRHWVIESVLLMAPSMVYHSVPEWVQHSEPWMESQSVILLVRHWVLEWVSWMEYQLGHQWAQQTEPWMEPWKVLHSDFGLD